MKIAKADFKVGHYRNNTAVPQFLTLARGNGTVSSINQMGASRHRVLISISSKQSYKEQRTWPKARSKR